MANFFSKRRLKIAEQIIIVIFFAVIIPMTISSIIINNVNQQSNRAQLREAAVMIANIVSEEVDVFQHSIDNELSQISTTLEYYNSPEKANDYLDTILKNMPFYKELAVIYPSEIDRFKHYKNSKDFSIFTREQKDGTILLAVLDMKNLKENLFKTLEQDKRQIYVLAGKDNRLVASINYEENIFKSSVEQLPNKLQTDKSVVYGKIKNQPLVYHKKTKPDITIIVNTTQDLTRNLIDYNRDKILLSIIITTLTVFFIVGLYTSYLYINIRQLFKAIIAVSKGNYSRRIRLLTNIFTPFELVFLGKEFNKMITQINKADIRLKKKNKELRQLNEFRSNLIDTVSHEFRTPLTSIQGYTSRLMRQDIEIDEDTKQKSLRVIKKQAERLKRMIEDLLVIPDIEGNRLNFETRPVSISSVIENSIMLVKNDSNKEIINNIENCELEILADSDRIEQVFVNLIENAIKYSKENSSIILDYENEGNKLVLSVKNEYES